MDFWNFIRLYLTDRRPNTPGRAALGRYHPLIGLGRGKRKAFGLVALFLESHSVFLESLTALGGSPSYVSVEEGNFQTGTY